jgi:hypothetical protein
MISILKRVWNSWIETYEEFNRLCPDLWIMHGYPWVFYVNPEWYDIKNQEIDK